MLDCLELLARFADAAGATAIQDPWSVTTPPLYGRHMGDEEEVAEDEDFDEEDDLEDDDFDDEDDEEEFDEEDFDEEDEDDIDEELDDEIEDIDIDEDEEDDFDDDEDLGGLDEDEDEEPERAADRPTNNGLASCRKGMLPAIVDRLFSTRGKVGPLWFPKDASRPVAAGLASDALQLVGREHSAMAAPLDHSSDSSPESPTPETSTRRLREQSQIDFELEFLGRILEREPFFVAALRVHADNLAAKGQYARALQIDRRLVRLVPEDADRLVQPGVQLRRAGHDRARVLRPPEGARARLPDRAADCAGIPT